MSEYCLASGMEKAQQEVKGERGRDSLGFIAEQKKKERGGGGLETRYLESSTSGRRWSKIFIK